jgi:hypothetical protein
VNKTLRNNLKVEFGNTLVGNRNKCGDIDESPSDNDIWIYCALVDTDDSIIDWVVTIMEEIERRALFAINR